MASQQELPEEVCRRAGAESPLDAGLGDSCVVIEACRQLLSELVLLEEEWAAALADSKRPSNAWMHDPGTLHCEVSGARGLRRSRSESKPAKVARGGSINAKSSAASDRDQDHPSGAGEDEDDGGRNDDDEDENEDEDDGADKRFQDVSKSSPPRHTEADSGTDTEVGSASDEDEDEDVADASSSSSARVGATGTSSGLSPGAALATLPDEGSEYEDEYEYEDGGDGMKGPSMGDEVKALSKERDEADRSAALCASLLIQRLPVLVRVAMHVL